MFKTNKNLIILKSAILVLAFACLIFSNFGKVEASNESYYRYNPGNSYFDHINDYNYNYDNNSYNNYPSQNNNNNNNSNWGTNQSSNQNTNSQTSNNNSSNTTTKKTTVATAKTTAKTTNTKDTTKSVEQANSLAASAIFGSDTFLPSGFLQWLFFFILIVLVIILWRRIYIGTIKKNTPLKHH